MSGSLSVPNTFGAASGNVPASQLDNNYAAIVNYVNGREIAIGLVGSRPAFGTAGRYYLATDVNGGTLYVDSGTAWVQAGAGVSVSSLLPTPLKQLTGASSITGTVVETSLKSYAMPGATLATAGDLVAILVHYRTSADAFTKRFRLKFGGTTVADSGAVFTTGVAATGIITAQVLRITALTQTCVAVGQTSNDAQTWDTALGGGATFTTPAETLAGAVTIDFTAQLGNIGATATCELLQVVKWPVV